MRFEDADWQTGKEKCEEMGGHLPRPRHEWQVNLLKSVASNKDIWLSLNDLKKEATTDRTKDGALLE